MAGPQGYGYRLSQSGGSR